MSTAVLVIDVQEAFLFPDDRVHEGQRVVGTIRKVLDAARSNGVPTVFVQHDGKAGGGLEPGTAGWCLHRGLGARETEPVVGKSTPDSFHKTKLKETLDSMGVTELVVMGFQSDFCVDTTVRSAWRLGYGLILVSDGHSTYDNPAITAAQVIAHENHVLSRFSGVVTADEAISGFNG